MSAIRGHYERYRFELRYLCYQAVAWMARQSRRELEPIEIAATTVAALENINIFIKS